MKPIRVFYLLGSLNRGGTETLLLDLFNFAGQVPFEFSGIYRRDGALSEDFHSSRHKLFKLTPGRIWMIWLYLRRLRKLFKREKIEIVHAQQSLDAIYAWLASIGLPVKRVQTIHGFDINIGLFSKFLLALSLKVCHVNVFVSKTQQKHFEKAYRIRPFTKQVVVHNGINPEKFSIKNSHSIRTELGLSDTPVLFGTVGNFVPGHDQLTICRFLAKLSNAGFNFYFLFVGKKDESNPQLYDDCFNFCNDNNLNDKVIFLGSRSDVPALLRQLDAFFYSSDHDTFGISVIEALAAGVPVFVNDWEVMKEITENGKRVILYRTRDEDSLFDKFSSYINNPMMYKNQAIQNMEWAKQTYSIQNHLNSLSEVYQSMKY